MATKEDILEQIVGEYLGHEGYFVKHNLKFLPRRDHPDYVKNMDSNHSDIDVVGFHPTLEGDRKVLVVSCKSWQGGFNPASEIDAIENGQERRGREAWKSFRKLVVPKWSEAFVRAVREATGTDRFTHVVAVSRVVGDRAVWEGHPRFRAALGDNPLCILTFREMISEIQDRLTTTLAATEVGRMLQMFKAAGIHAVPD